MVIKFRTFCVWRVRAAIHCDMIHLPLTSSPRWDYVRSLVPTDMYFVPAFFFPNNQTIAGVVDCVEGLFQWNSAWSLDGSPVSTAADLSWAEQLGPNKTYIAGVSPTFFTHYPVYGLDKNFVYRSENNYATRWQQVTDIDSPMVEVISTLTRHPCIMVLC